DSLLRATGSGRFERHPLLYAFMCEKLAEDPAQERKYREAHCRHYLGKLREAPQGSPAQAACLLTQDLENVRQAWHVAVDTGLHELLGGCSRQLAAFLDRSARAREGVEMFRAASASLPPGMLLAELQL